MVDTLVEILIVLAIFAATFGAYLLIDWLIGR